MPLFIPSSKIVRPRWGRRFARNANLSLFPSLWPGKIGQWVPALGKTGVIVRDVARFANPGDLTNIAASTRWVIGQRRYSIHTNGAGEFIDLGTSSLIKPVAGLSLCAWVNAAVLDDFKLIIDSSNESGALTNGYRLLFNLTTTKWRVLIGDGIGNSLIDSISDALIGIWTFLCATWDGETLRLYVNGIEENSIAFSAPIVYDTAPNAVYIGWEGSEGSGDQSWEGDFGSVSIYNRALAFKEIRTLYEIPDADMIPRQRVSGNIVIPIPPIEPSLLPEYGQIRTAIGDPPVYGATILRS